METAGVRNWEDRVRALGLKGKLPERLTDTVVQAAQRRPTGERYKLRDGAVPGLVLQVGPSGDASFLLCYRTAGGRQGQKLTHKIGAPPMTVEQAREHAKEVLQGLKKGIDPQAAKREAAAKAAREKVSTVGAYLALVYGPEVLAHRKDGGAPKTPEDKSSGTYARISAAWEPLMKSPLATLSRGEIEKTLSDRKASGKAAGTLLRDWSAFRALLADAVDRGALAAIPMARRPEPIRKMQGAQRVRWLSQHDPAERDRFMAALAAAPDVGGCTADFLRFAVQLALATGLRRGEIVRLADRMINVRTRTIVLPSEITKSNKSRVVSLSDAALAALDGWKVRGTKGELCPGSSEMWEDRITQQGWPALCTAAGIDDLHFHDCRHDFAVRMLRAGATLVQVRDALGHASITQTEKYAHVVPSEVHEAVLKLGARQ